MGLRSSDWTSGLWGVDTQAVSAAEADEVAERVWRLISLLRVSTSGTKIVAGLKTLHHLLPDLVPPIDRQYTVQFFTGQKQVSKGERTSFHEWFTLFCEIGRKRRESIDVILRRAGFMATSSSRVIDNAIVGFARTQRTKD